MERKYKFRNFHNKDNYDLYTYYFLNTLIEVKLTGGTNVKWNSSIIMKVIGLLYDFNLLVFISYISFKSHKLSPSAWPSRVNAYPLILGLSFQS